MHVAAALFAAKSCHRCEVLHPAAAPLGILPLLYYHKLLHYAEIVVARADSKSFTRALPGAVSMGRGRRNCLLFVPDSASAATDLVIRSQPQRKRPFVAKDDEISHGRNIALTQRDNLAQEHIHEAWIGTSWIVEMSADGSRDGKPFRATQL